MPSALLTIGALARKTGVTVKTIRFYSDMGLLPPREITASGYRLYAADDQARLELIRTLRGLEFTLEDIARLLEHGRPIKEALQVQRDAVDAALRRLRRTRAVLDAALGSAEDQALAKLGRLQVLTVLERCEREAVLQKAMQQHLRDIPIDASWLAWFHETAFAGLPDELDDAQWAALIELTELVHDQDFGRKLAAQAQRFWSAARDFDFQAWQTIMGNLVNRALAAMDQGELPEGKDAQLLVDELVGMWAQALRRKPGPAFERWVMREVATNDPRAERFWELVAIVRGWPTPSPQARAYRWLFDGLAARTRRARRTRRTR